MKINLKKQLNIGAFVILISGLIILYAALYAWNVSLANSIKAEHFWSEINQTLLVKKEQKFANIGSWNFKQQGGEVKESVIEKKAIDFNLLAVFLDADKSKALISTSGKAKWFSVGSVIDGFVLEQIKLNQATLKDDSGQSHLLKINLNNKSAGVVGADKWSLEKNKDGSASLIDLGKALDKVAPPRSLPPLPPSIP